MWRQGRSQDLKHSEGQGSKVPQWKPHMPKDIFDYPPKNVSKIFFSTFYTSVEILICIF